MQKVEIILRYNRGADPQARRMGAGRRPGSSLRAQSGPVPCSGALRRDKVLDEVSAAIPAALPPERLNQRHGPLCPLNFIVGQNYHSLVP